MLFSSHKRAQGDTNKLNKTMFENKTKTSFHVQGGKLPIFLLNFVKNPFLSEKRLSTSKQVRKFRMKSFSVGRWCIDLAPKNVISGN